MTECVTAYFDGLCYPDNPGGLACGGRHILPHPDVPALTYGLRGGNYYRQGDGATNNVAEYEAGLDVLRAIYRTGYRGPVVLRSDSQLVVQQVNGAWRCKAQHLHDLRDKLQHAMTHFAYVGVEWVPREQNKVADQQSRLAYKRAVRNQKVGPSASQQLTPQPQRLPGR